MLNDISVGIFMPRLHKIPVFLAQELTYRTAVTTCWCSWLPET